MEAAVRLPPSDGFEGKAEVDPRLTKDGIHYFILPAFFNTLQVNYFRHQESFKVQCWSSTKY